MNTALKGIFLNNRGKQEKNFLTQNPFLTKSMLVFGGIQKRITVDT